jgi:hypothetical protein
MSMETYPEVSGDEAAIVPSQSARPPEWPKKIRTLTAAELDRLTIDGSGRFYWDGKLVNYEPPLRPKEPETKSTEKTEGDAMDIIDRAVYELGDHKAPEPIEGAELPKPVGTSLSRERAVDLDLADIEAAAAGHVEGESVTPVVRPGGRLHVSLSRWQAIGAVLLVISVIISSIGLAAFGWVAAHDWGCRTGLMTNYCSGHPGARFYTDIPA